MLHRRAIVLFALGVAVLSAGARGETGSELARIAERPSERLAEPVEADASELLALGPDEQANLLRWLRRGGSLRLTGDVVEPALSLFDEAAATAEAGRLSVGLGQVLTGAGSSPVTHPPGDELLAAAARLARSQLPDRGRLDRSEALRLVAFVLLLVVGLLASRRAPRSWRIAGALSLVVVFGSWPAWSRLAPSADRWHQVDVEVDTAAGPTLRWSAAALLAGARHPVEVRPGPGAWSLHAPVGTDEPPGDGHGPVAHLRPVRGQLVELNWLSDGAGEAEVTLELVRRGDRLAGFIRNRSSRGWSDVWLLLPGREPLRLDDLPPADARVLDMPLPPATRTAPAVDSELSPRRGRLIDAVLRTAGRSLLDRDMPVLVAWADGSGEPPSISKTPRRDGTTLLLAAARPAR